MDTVETQVADTLEAENEVVQKIDTPSIEKKVETKTEPYKSFATKEEFDKHSVGILNSAKNKAEKELLSLLGLKPDEKDKLAKFKEAYDATLSESEKQAQNLENLTNENESLKLQLAEKDAIIIALSKFNDKSSIDVGKYVKMAKGLVDEETSMEQALEQVFSILGREKTAPKGKPLSESSTTVKVENPFESGNLTKQGEMIRTDREKARSMYMAVHGKAPSW